MLHHLEFYYKHDKVRVSPKCKVCFGRAVKRQKQQKEMEQMLSNNNQHHYQNL
jgi:hypothetical protein